jgi:hypothetical protein
MRPWRFVGFTKVLEALSAYLEDGGTSSFEDFMYFYQIAQHYIQE